MKHSSQQSPSICLCCKTRQVLEIPVGLLHHYAVWIQVLVPAPFWVSYPEMVKLAGAESVIVDCPAEDNFLLTPAALQASLCPASRLLILCSPSNPTGSVYSRCAPASAYHACLIPLYGLLSMLHAFIMGCESHDTDIWGAEHGIQLIPLYAHWAGHACCDDSCHVYHLRHELLCSGAFHSSLFHETPAPSGALLGSSR